MTETATSYNVGDPLRICDDGKDAYCVVVEKNDGDIVQVQMLEQGHDKLYRIGGQTYDIDHDMVIDHHDLEGDDNMAPRAFQLLGFRMIDGSTFVKHSDEVGDTLFPVGDGAFEALSDDSDDEGSLKDFIVPDDECEPFTHPTDDSDFVRDTHAAVRAFNAWVPANEQEAQARSFMIRQEARAAHIDDEARFARNMTGANYSNPE